MPKDSGKPRRARHRGSRTTAGRTCGGRGRGGPCGVQPLCHYRGYAGHAPIPPASRRRIPTACRRIGRRTQTAVVSGLSGGTPAFGAGVSARPVRGSRRGRFSRISKRDAARLREGVFHAGYPAPFIPRIGLFSWAAASLSRRFQGPSSELDSFYWGTRAFPGTFWGAPRLSYRTGPVKIAEYNQKSAVRKASRRKKRPCKEFPCRAFLLFALPRAL